MRFYRINSERGYLLNRILKIIGISSLALIILIGAVFFIYVSDYSKALPAVLKVMQSDTDVAVYNVGDLLVFEPSSGKMETGFIFYPGGKVDYRAYSSIMKELARKGYLCIIAKMPFNLAVLAQNKADEAISSFPKIRNWAIGGHSLGGVMASSYALKHDSVIDAIIFYASYPISDISKSGFQILTIHGTKDGLVTKEKFAGSIGLLPVNSTVKSIIGGNHANFGVYGSQKGDNASDISGPDQRKIIIDTTAEFLKTVK